MFSVLRVEVAALTFGAGLMLMFSVSCCWLTPSFSTVHHFLRGRRMCPPQVPDASITMPDISGSLPEVSGEVSVPSVGGGVDVDVAVPSVDADASAPSASIDLPGEHT